MSEISFKIFTLYVPTINNHSIVYEKYTTITAVGLSDIASILGSLSGLRASERITEEDLNNFIAAGYNVEDNLIDSSTSSFVEIINEDPTGGVPYDYETLSSQLVNSTVDSPVIAYLDKYKLETYLATLPTPITPSDTPLVSMVLVDDENNKTTFNGPIINDFTITENLQSKITQLTTLATNISNLQTRLTNITNILNTQNIEFTDNVSDVSSSGSKLYIQPQVYLKLTNLSTYSEPVYRYLNLTPYVTGKYSFTDGVSLDVTCSLGLESDFDPTGWVTTLGPNSVEGLTLNVGGTTEAIGFIAMNGVTIYENGAVNSSPATSDYNSTININSVSGSVGTINIEFIK